MTEKELINNIINRLQFRVYHEDDNCIEFEIGHYYESTVIEFDENGFVTDIY